MTNIGNRTPPDLLILSHPIGPPTPYTIHMSTCILDKLSTSPSPKLHVVTSSARTLLTIRKQNQPNSKVRPFCGHSISVILMLAVCASHLLSRSLYAHCATPGRCNVFPNHTYEYQNSTSYSIILNS